MFIKEAYQFLFYKLYKTIKITSTPELWSDWKAICFMGMLEIALYFSLSMFYSIYINRYSTSIDNNLLTALYGAFIITLNYLMFEHKDRWKDIVQKFDKMERKKSIIGGWIVLGVILSVALSLIFAFHLTSQIDWSLYR